MKNTGRAKFHRICRFNFFREWCCTNQLSEISETLAVSEKGTSYMYFYILGMKFFLFGRRTEILMVTIASRAYGPDAQTEHRSQNKRRIWKWNVLYYLY